MVVEHVVCGPEELLIFMMFGHELLTGSFVESAGFDVFSLMEVGTHGLVEQVLIPVVPQDIHIHVRKPKYRQTHMKSNT